MWMWKLFLVLEFLFCMVKVSDAWGLCTCKLCYHCTGCSATSCKGRNRALSLLDYLDRYDQEVNRQLQVTSPVIPCSIPNKMCDPPYNKYCCDGTTMTCGLGEGWSTCVAGSTLINNIITPIYTKSQCDFDFPCTGNGGNDCCGGLDLYNGEGGGTCSTTYCTSSDLQLVACNYVGFSALVYKTPDFDATILVNGLIPTQSNNEYCGDGNRNSGRCRASNLCCSPLGLCSKVDSCTTKSISWAWYGGSINNWVQTGGAADSSIPCGNGIIGHGRCPTDASTYGIQCCSDTGFCSSSYCNGASGNDYPCSCAHGTAGRGTRGCKTCASCNDAYYLSSSNGNTCSPVKLGNFNCPSSSSFITSIDLWYDSGSKFITGIDSFSCSDGSLVNVNKGQHTGAHKSPTEPSGYCGGRVGYVYRPSGTTNQFTTELTVSSCDNVTSTTFGGPIPTEPTNFSIAYGFQGGKQLTGLQAATCENAGSNNVCFLNFIFTTVQTPSPTQSTVPTAAPTPVPTQTVCSPLYSQCGGISWAGPKCCVSGLVCVPQANNPYYSECFSATVAASAATTIKPTFAPSAAPTPSPTSKPTAVPSSAPTTQPTLKPSTASPATPKPSPAAPTTPKPSVAPTNAPTTSAPTACGTIVGCQVDTTCACTGCDSGYTYLSTVKKCCKNVSRCNQFSSSTCACTGCKSPYLLANGKCATTSPPSASPTSAAPTPSPTSKPTAVPSSAPTTQPTFKPSTASPMTPKPSTAAPTTPKPSVAPTNAPTGTCSCINGVGAVGEFNCTTCISCNSGYVLISSTAPYCTRHVPSCPETTTVVTCAAGAFITQLKMKYLQTGTAFVNGITSMTCSDGVEVSVNAGGKLSGDTPFTATAGDGSSSSPGYCASSMVYGTYIASQLKLTECTGSVDGPFGSNEDPTPITVTKTCGIAEKGVGVETTPTRRSGLVYFSIVCGPIP